MGDELFPQMVTSLGQRASAFRLRFLCRSNLYAIINYIFYKPFPRTHPGTPTSPGASGQVPIIQMGSKIRAIVDAAAQGVSVEALVAFSAGLAVIIGYWLLRKIQHGKKYKLPPRVLGVPLFGNAFQIPALQQGPWAKGLAEKYGEMFVLYALVTTLKMLIILGKQVHLQVRWHYVGILELLAYRQRPPRAPSRPLRVEAPIPHGTRYYVGRFTHSPHAV